MIRILIADDHAIVREGFKQILAETPDMVVAGEAANGHEVLDMVRKGDWDLVILDIAMPGKDGLETLKELKQQKPGLQVLILSIYPEEQYAVRLLRAGAAGYLTKESAPDELIAAIRKVSNRGKYVSASLAEKLAWLLEAGSEEPLHELLSDREYKVMLTIATGKTVSEIAEEMCLSIKTISTYRARALKKMGMKTNAEFSYYALKNGLLG
jgi:two-component system, NarL family, invasion response regulator UvrY